MNNDNLFSVNSTVPMDQILSGAAKFKAIGNPTRLEILTVVAKYNNKVCGGDFEKLVKIKQPTISHHINVLMKAGLIKNQKEGTRVFYSINPEIILNLMKDLKNLIA